MAIGAELEKKLSKIYEPSTTLELTFKGNDLTIVTNKEGEAVTLCYWQKEGKQCDSRRTILQKNCQRQGWQNH